MLAGHCREIGRDFGEIVRSANYNVVIGRDEAEIEDRLARIAAAYRPFLAPDGLAAAVDSYRKGPLVGTPEQIVEKLWGLDRLGLAYAILYFADAALDPSSIELFAKEVIPALASDQPALASD